MERTRDDSAPETIDGTGTAPPDPPLRTNRLGAWLRSTGIVRGDGWVGGVCAGVARVLGVDAVIVRGVVGVVAVLGGPAVLLYAAAWFFLPARDGTILAERLVHGRLEKAMFGVAALVLLSFLPLTQGFWYAGAAYWGEPDLAGSVGRVLWTVVVIAGAVIFLLWFAGRAVAVRQTADSDDESPDVDGHDRLPEHAPATHDIDTSAEPAAPREPPGLPPDATADDLRAWKDQQALWKRQRAAWVADQRRTDRERFFQRSRTRAVEAAAASAERRRINRLTRPRLSAGLVAGAVGLATVSGGTAALLTLGTRYPAVVGLGAATLVLGLSIAAAGLGRRRPGVLSFLGGVALLSLLAAALLPSERVFLPFVSSWGLPTAESGNYATLSGILSLYVDDDDPETEIVDIWQGEGGVLIDVEAGRTVRVEANTNGPNITVGRYTLDGGVEQLNDAARYVPDGDRFASVTVIGDAAVPDLIVRIWQGRGWLDIRQASGAETPPPQDGTGRQQ